MRDDGTQLTLFASSTPRSISCEPTSARSSEHATHSNGSATNTPSDAIAITTSRNVPASRPRAGAGAAAASLNAAKRMAAPELPLTTSRNTSSKSTETMLAIPRPTTRAECERGMEARPCPWVSCRHHLLLEVATIEPIKGRDARPPTLRMNRPNATRNTIGRRKGLANSAARELVQTWIDDAVELLPRMRYTCSLDVAEDYPDGVSESSVAWLLGVTESAVHAELRVDKERLREGLSEYADHAPGDHVSTLGRAGGA
jgi:hypothetical protein